MNEAIFTCHTIEPSEGGCGEREWRLETADVPAGGDNSLSLVEEMDKAFKCLKGTSRSLSYSTLRRGSMKVSSISASSVIFRTMLIYSRLTPLRSVARSNLPMSLL